MTEPRHRRITRRTATLAGVAAFLLTGIAGWAISRAADTTYSAVPAGDPISVEVTIDDDADHVVPSGRLDLSAARAAERAGKLTSYVSKVGGTSTSGLMIKLLVYGRRNSPVVVNNIRATQVSCVEPTAKWTLLFDDHGGPMTPLLGDVALGDGNAENVIPEGHWRFPRQVSTADADEFAIDPQPATGDICSFALRIDYHADKKDGSLIITNGGRPFRVADRGVAIERDYVGR